MPIFQYHISGLPGVLTENSPLWKIPLMGKDAEGILIHEYFDLAKKFLQSDNYSALQGGVESILKRRCAVDAFDQIDIYLEKHGAFYHPARIEVAIKETPLTLFALNTAVSTPGLAIINDEYHLLEYLNKLDPNHFLPKVFCVESMECRGLKIAFFLATWFDGYQEFHLTDNPDNPDTRVLHLWRGDGSIIKVPHPDYFEIYEKASEILTFFYNIKTFEQISFWHHAAGDFIARQTTQGFDVKLITVRNYTPVVESDSSLSDDGDQYGENIQNTGDGSNIEDIYKALLLFFLNLTLHMRIDRINGTGDRCLVDAKVIPFVLRGFFRALEKKQTKSGTETEDNIQSPLNKNIQKSFIDGFKSYLMQFNHESLYRIFTVMIDEANPDNPETSFIRKILKSHSEILSSYICSDIASIP